MADTMDTYRTLTPYLVVLDADAEIRFLTAAFGATEKSVDRRPDGQVMHAEIVVGDSLLMLGPANDTWKALSGALYGHRNAGVVDANGITWWIGSPVK